MFCKCGKSWRTSQRPFVCFAKPHLIIAFLAYVSPFSSLSRLTSRIELAASCKKSAYQDLVATRFSCHKNLCDSFVEWTRFCTSPIDYSMRLFALSARVRWWCLWLSLFFEVETFSVPVLWLVSDGVVIVGAVLMVGRWGVEVEVLWGSCSFVSFSMVWQFDFVGCCLFAHAARAATIGEAETEFILNDDWQTVIVLSLRLLFKSALFSSEREAAHKMTVTEW